MKKTHKTIVALFSVCVLLLAVSLTGCLEGDEDKKDEEKNLDKDGDGMLDEWELLYGLNPSDPTDAHLDPDNDGLDNLEEHGTRTVPTDPDTDDDEAKDGEDVDPLIDSVVVVQFTHYKMEDPGDIGTEVDVYFKIRLNDVELTSDIIHYDTDEGDIPLDFSTFYDMPDDTAIVGITFSWFDDDLFFDDKLDCSGTGDSCDLVYSIENHSWWGDTNNGTTSGEYDGSTDTDEDDVTIEFTIFDSVGNADEIEAILNNSGSDNGMEDFNELVRYHGHVILNNVIQWCLDNPEKFLYKGGWSTILGIGLIILGIAIYLYEDYHLQNEDTP
ncbi:MAG: hypothetical protein JSV56_02155 [Methanomassiliicoccales archaeon]|nr:MAG: hypothetical protein JSV56_02155 [Methanomassiliicoccales archaeon]